MRRLLLVSLVLAVLGVPVALRAEEDATSPPPAHNAPVTKSQEVEPPIDEPEANAVARVAWTWWRATIRYNSDLLAQARAWRKAAVTDAQKERVRTTPLDVLHVSRKAVEEAEEAFRVAFAASELAAWEDQRDREILSKGLDNLARHALAQDPAKALVWWEQLLARQPTSREAQYARWTWLPILLPGLLEPEAALLRLAPLADAVPAIRKPNVLMAMGDVHALAGDVQAARALYRDAKAAVPTDVTMKGGPKPPRDLALRLALLGSDAPPLEAARVFGDGPATLEALKGRVVLLDFTATWCGPCLKMLPHVEALAAEYADAGLSVVGITREYQQKGVLPEREGQERVLYRGTTRAEYVQHLEAFRERVGMHVPLWLVEREAYHAYPLTGIPTFLVLGREGRVAFVAVGGMRQHLLRRAVERCLGEE